MPYISMPRRFRTGVDEARRLVLQQIDPLPAGEVALADAAGRIVADDLSSRVDSPSVDASLRDGYALRWLDLKGATADHPVRLTSVGLAAAGGNATIEVVKGTTARVLTGAGVPDGADTVVPEEEIVSAGGEIAFASPVKPGAFILTKGGELARGDTVVRVGDRLSPARIGLLAAAGYHRLRVVRPPVVAIAAIGDELVEPGTVLSEGKLYASNMAFLTAWCRRCDWSVHAAISADAEDQIEQTLRDGIERGDALITCGGAWTGDRDLVVGTLERMGWREVFLSLRMVPGKGVGFGRLHEKPVFVLPGGPPAAMVGFLQVVLPALLRLSGVKEPGLPWTAARLSTDLVGRDRAWTQFVFGRLLKTTSNLPLFDRLPRRRRLVAMAEAEALAAIPEGRRTLPSGSTVSVQLLD